MSLTVLRIVITLSGLIEYIEPSSVAASAAGIDVKVWFNFSLSRLLVVVAVVEADASCFSLD
ncbi:hypothetical protein D3C84_1236990 [compost metagenome]